MKKVLLGIIYSLFLTFSLSGVVKENNDLPCPDSTVVTRSRIYYPINKIKIYEDYMSNPHELELIKRHLAISPKIDSITIYSYASPEGPYRFNKWLAKQRGITAKRYILSNIPEFRQLPDSLVRILPTAENWEGLREEIVNSYELDNRAEVLEILDMQGVTDSRRKTMLKRLDNGFSWRYILRNIMPRLRYATWISVWQPVGGVIPTQALSSLKVDSVSLQPPVISHIPKIYQPVLLSTDSYSAHDSKTILAFKTNLLYDALSLMNYSIEVPFCGDKFSALFYHQFPWWRWGENNNKYCIRFLSLGGEGRWWFKPQPRPETEKYKKRDRLEGHFIGVYSESGKYDFERRRDICYQGEFWSAGLSYGYSMPITRWLNLELSVSAGYASIAYRGYTPSPDYSILWRDYDKVGRWHYFGLTKAQVSLVLPITVKFEKGGMK